MMIKIPFKRFDSESNRWKHFKSSLKCLNIRKLQKLLMVKVDLSSHLMVNGLI